VAQTCQKACETSHPTEALSIYQDRIEDIIRLTNNNAYDRAAEMLVTIKKLMHKLKHSQQFDRYIEQLRTRYKQKRNFIQKLEKI
jgi:uncharacterized Zn finger protein